MPPRLKVRAGVALVASLTARPLGHRANRDRPATAPPGHLYRISVGRAPFGDHPGLIAADDDAAWVATDRGLWRIDARTGRAVNLPGTRGGDYPTVGEGFAWESCGQGQGPVPGFPCEGRTVLKLDPLTGAVLATIKVPGIPFAIATGLGSVWVATTSGLVKIDPVTARVVSTLPVVPLFVGTAGGAVWVGSAPGAVWTVPAR